MTKLPNIHPGEILREEFLKPMGISQCRLAKSIGVPARHIDEMCAGKRSITTDPALRFSRAFGTTPEFWLGLQADYDTEEAKKIAGGFACPHHAVGCVTGKKNRDDRTYEDSSQGCTDQSKKSAHPGRGLRSP